MIVKYCDRCKKKIEEPKSYSSIHEMLKENCPAYTIKEDVMNLRPAREVHLCNKCSIELYKWLRGYEDGD